MSKIQGIKEELYSRLSEAESPDALDKFWEETIDDYNHKWRVDKMLGEIAKALSLNVSGREETLFALGERTQEEREATLSVLRDVLDVSEPEPNMEKINAITREHIEEVRKKELEDLKNSPQNLDNYFHHLRHYVKIVLNSRDVHSLFVMGEAGIGKSTNILRTLAQEGVEFEYKQGNITPLALYSHLYHNNDKVLVFDDTQGLIKNKSSMSVLFAALWSATPTRWVSWDSTVSRIKDLPKKFEFKGKVIFCMNELPENTDFETLVSRCFFYRLAFTYDQLIEIMFEIAKKDSDLSSKIRTEIVEYIKENTSPATKNFDLRLQKKIEEIYRYDNENWKGLAEPFLEDKDSDVAAYIQIVTAGFSGSEAVKRFRELTGKKKSTYYRVGQRVEL